MRQKRIKVQLASTVCAVIAAIGSQAVEAKTVSNTDLDILNSAHSTVDVTANVGAAFTVRLPDNIELLKNMVDGKHSYTSSIGVKGDIECGKSISVLPDTKFNLYDVSNRPLNDLRIPESEDDQVSYNHKVPEQARVTQKESIWSQEELSRTINVQDSNFIYDSESGYHNVELTVKTDNKLTAGKWAGQIAFDIMYGNITGNVQALKEADYPVGTTIDTLGYHSKQDGGAATYLITESDKVANDRDVIALDNGKKAELVVVNDTIVAEQFGAYGDGTHDDVVPLQAALDSGHKVNLTKGKNYLLVSNGLAIRNSWDLNGNGATIKVNDTYSPISPEFSKRVIRYNNQPHDSFKLSNLNIVADFSSDRFVDGNYLVLLQPTYVDDVELDNVDITINNSYNQITNFWMDHGCSNLVVRNCDFDNRTTYREGGVFWLFSNNDTLHHRYQSFDNCVVEDCNFTGTCGDEFIGMWGMHDINAEFNNLNIDWNRAYTDNTSRVVSISSGDEGTYTFDVSFNDSTFLCRGVETDTRMNIDSFVGIGSKYPDNKIKVAFNDCNVDAKVRNSLVHFQQLPKTPSLIPTFDFSRHNNNVIFNDCDITCDKALTGSATFVDSKSLDVMAQDCEFNNCDIQCRYAAAILQCYSTNDYYTPTIKMDTCTVNITDSIGVIFKTNHGAKAGLEITASDFTTDNVFDSLYSYRYNANVVPKSTQQNANLATESITRCTLNNVSVN